MKRAAFLMIAVGSTSSPTAGPGRGGRRRAAGARYAQQRIAADLRDGFALLAASSAANVTDNYKEALNLVRQAYIRERADVRIRGRRWRSATRARRRRISWRSSRRSAPPNRSTSTA